MKKLFFLFPLFLLFSCNQVQVWSSDIECKKLTPHFPGEWTPVISAGPVYGKYSFPDGKTNIEWCVYEVKYTTSSGEISYALYLMKTEKDQFFVGSDKSIIETRIK